MSNFKQFDVKIMLDSATEKIKKTITKMTEDYMYMSFLLWEVREYKYYEYAEPNPYPDVSTYSEMEFGFSKSQTSRLIKLCENFSAKTKTGSPSMHIADRFKDFNMSQLVEMLCIPSEKWGEITSDMSVKKLREVRKEMKKSVATSQLKIQEELKSDNLNEIMCQNCGKVYSVDKRSKKQCIIINGKTVFSCCFEIKWDIDLLKKD